MDYAISLKKGIKSLGKEEAQWQSIPFKGELDTHLTPLQVAPHSPLILNLAPTPIEESATQAQENHGQSYYHC